MIQSRHQLQSTGGCELAASDLSIIWLLRNYCWNEAPPRVRVPRLAKVPAREGGLGNLLLSVYGVVLGGTICTLCDARFLGVRHALFWKRLLLVGTA